MQGRGQIVGQSGSKVSDNCERYHDTATRFQFLYAALYIFFHKGTDATRDIKNPLFLKHMHFVHQSTK